MTVKELIGELLEYDLDAEVNVRTDDGIFIDTLRSWITEETNEVSLYVHISSEDLYQSLK